MSTNPIELSGPAAAAAITAASSIIAEALGRSASRTHSKEASNQLAVRIGELARMVLEALQREPAAAVAPNTGVAADPSANAAPDRLLARPGLVAVEAASACSVGW